MAKSQTLKKILKYNMVQGAEPELSPSTVVKGDSSGSAPCTHFYKTVWERAWLNTFFWQYYNKCLLEKYGAPLISKSEAAATVVLTKLHESMKTSEQVQWVQYTTYFEICRNFCKTKLINVFRKCFHTSVFYSHDLIFVSLQSAKG